MRTVRTHKNSLPKPQTGTIGIHNVASILHKRFWKGLVTAPLHCALRCLTHSHRIQFIICIYFNTPIPICTELPATTLAGYDLHFCLCISLHISLHASVSQCPSQTVYGVVPKGSLTFLGSLYKEVAKTTSGTLVYRFERQTARKKKSSFQKHWVLDLECKIFI